MKARLATWITGLALLWLLSSTVMAAASQAPVNIEADELHFLHEEQIYKGRGDVRLRQQDRTLKADQVHWDRRQKTATATGHVHLQEPDGWLAGERLNLDLATGAAELFQGRGFFLEHNVHFQGTKIRRESGQRYYVTDGHFTTCDGQPPVWKFSAGQLQVTKGGFAKAYHVLFHLYDIPVFYLPYISYPVKTERQSGFLMPRYGYSSDDGWQLSLAWYQVISRSQDITLLTDMFTQKGLGVGAEYRYKFAPDNSGRLHVYHIADVAGNNEDFSADSVTWEHYSMLPHNWLLHGDVEYVSDEEYFEDFGESAPDYNQDETQSRIALSRAFYSQQLGAQLFYSDDLRNNRDTDNIPQRLPEFRYQLARSRLGKTPLFFGGRGQAVYFQRQEGATGWRTDVRPQLSAAWRWGPVEFLPQLAWRQRIYSLDREQDELDDSLTAGQLQGSVMLRSQWRKVYGVDDEKARPFSHVLEPRLSYHYRDPAFSDEEEMPLFDAEDRLNPYNYISLGLVNRWTGRYESPEGAKHYHEFLYLRLAQEYSVRTARHDREDELEIDPLRALRTEVIWEPRNIPLQVDWDSRYDYQQTQFDDIIASVDGDVWALGWGLDYTYHRDDTEYIAARMELPLGKVNVAGQYRYNVQKQETLEKILQTSYQGQCWGLMVSLRDRPEDTEVLVSLRLSGLGEVTRFGTTLAEEEGDI